MTPKEKAIELVDKFDDATKEDSLWISKRCSLVCVNEIIEQYETLDTLLPIDFIKQQLNYFKEVKTEIEKL